MRLSSIIASIVFPLIVAFAVYMEYGHALTSGLVEDLKNEYCMRSAVASDNYGFLATGIPALDQLFCTLVAFFRLAAENQPATVTLAYVLGNLAVPATIILIEPFRMSTSQCASYPLLGSPTTLGLLYQAISMGPTMGMYWLTRIWSYDTHSLARETFAVVNRAHAEALVFGVIVGMVLPTIAMMTMPTPATTGLWQFFPVAVKVLRHGYTQFVVKRGSPKHTQPGRILLHDLFVFMFTMFWLLHALIVYPMLTNPTTLHAAILPSLSNAPQESPLTRRIIHFLKWDCFMGVLATYLGTILLSNTLLEAIKMAAWYLVATPIVGPGAALAAVYLRREL